MDVGQPNDAQARGIRHLRKNDRLGYNFEIAGCCAGLEDKEKHIRLTHLPALTLAVLALGMTLHAEDSDARKKKATAPAPKAPAKAVTPRTVSSTALSEVLATNVTIAPGAYQQFTSQTDFTGADSVNIAFYGTNDQDFSKTAYTIWWAFPGAPNYVATTYFAGTQFAFLNSGGEVCTAFGNQMLVGIQNNGTNPVTYIQVTVWANAR